MLLSSATNVWLYFLFSYQYSIMSLLVNHFVLLSGWARQPEKASFTKIKQFSRDKSPEARQNMLRNLFRVPRASVMIQSVRHGRDAYVATTAIYTKSLYE